MATKHKQKRRIYCERTCSGALRRRQRTLLVLERLIDVTQLQHDEFRIRIGNPIFWGPNYIYTQCFEQGEHIEQVIAIIADRRGVACDAQRIDADLAGVTASDQIGPEEVVNYAKQRRAALEVRPHRAEVSLVEGARR